MLDRLSEKKKIFFDEKHMCTHSRKADVHLGIKESESNLGKERKQGVRPHSRTDMLSAATFGGQVYMHVKSAAAAEASAV